MKKNNAYKFDKKTSRQQVEIEIGKKVYVIRANEYFVNKAVKTLESIDPDNEDVFGSLDNVFDALSYLYGVEALEEIAEDNLDIDWGEFLKFSIAMASGLTPEQYAETLEETSKNQ